MSSAADNSPDALALSALISSRLCHDLINPVGALSSGLEVLADPSMDEGMKEAAIDLIKSSAAKSVALLKYARLAYGASGGLGAELPYEEAKHVLDGIISCTKAKLDWRIGPGQAPKDEVKALLVMGLSAADCVPRGGSVTIEGGKGNYTISVTGDRVILQDDLVEAIAGAAEDLKPKFAPHFIAGLAARQAGGEITAEQSDGAVSFRVRFATEIASGQPALTAG